METSTYIFIAALIFVIAKAFLTPSTPIPETSGRVNKPLSAAEFDALLASNVNVVVDFYADWCPPCRAIAPTFSGLADNHTINGHLAFAKVNVDHVKDIAGRYGVSAMPTFVFFKDGKVHGVKAEGMAARGSLKMNADGEVERVLGADKQALERIVETLAGKR